jgi:hypothetical protein
MDLASGAPLAEPRACARADVCSVRAKEKAVGKGRLTVTIFGLTDLPPPGWVAALVPCVRAHPSTRAGHQHCFPPTRRVHAKRAGTSRSPPPGCPLPPQPLPRRAGRRPMGPPARRFPSISRLFLVATPCCSRFTIAGNLVCHPNSCRGPVLGHLLARQPPPTYHVVSAGADTLLGKQTVSLAGCRSKQTPVEVPELSIGTGVPHASSLARLRRNLIITPH